MIKNRKRGRNTYVPPRVFEELGHIKQEGGLNRNCEAFNEMVLNSKIGREVKKMRNRFLMKDIFGKK